jgi:hypothetical protein
MKFAFHILGQRVEEFGQLVPDVPKTLFFQKEPSVLDEIGVYFDQLGPIPDWPGLSYQQYWSNICITNSLCSVYYGDVRQMSSHGVPVVCDIMEESFWYYYKNLKRFGLFTFSVNSNLCDPVVFQSIIRFLCQEATAVSYKELR